MGMKPTVTSRLGMPGKATATPTAMDTPLSEPVALDIDLLPDWYPRMVRRRRWLKWQAWATGVLVVVLTTLLVLRREDEHVRQVELHALQGQREQTQAVLDELQHQEARLRHLAQQASLIEKVGLPVEVTRILAEIAQALPNRAALTTLAVQTETVPLTAIEKVRAEAAGREPTSQMWLRFRMRGVTSNDADVAALLDQLQRESLFRECTVSYGRAVELHGVPAVEFEVFFKIDLSLGGAGGRGPTGPALAGEKPGGVL